MIKRRIDFQKLIDGAYPLDVELEVFNWMLATGKKYDGPRAGYGHSGMDQIVYGYSANTHNSYTDLGKDFETTLQLGFVNAIVKTPIPSVLDWRNTERVGLGKFRILSFPDERPFSRWNWNLYREIKGIYEYKGRLLRKEHFHPEYPERTEPKILEMQFSTAGSGYRITLEFSFKNFDYEPGWEKSFSQREGEGIDMFIYRFHREMSQLLLPQVSVDQANKMLQSATRRCHPGDVIEASRKALRDGADVNAKDPDGNTPLHIACKNGRVDLARLLLFYGADVNAPAGKSGWTPLHVVCWSNQDDFVRLFLKAGADVNALDLGGSTALHYASRSGFVDVVRLLIEYGADVNAKNNSMRSSLDLAVGNGIPGGFPGAPVIPILLDRGGVLPEEKLDQVLATAVCMDESNPHKGPILDWFQENRPELYFSAFCTADVSPGIG